MKTNILMGEYKMKISVQVLAKSAIVIGLSIALSGCASLRQKTLKSPCGPLASLDGPCSDRTPINDIKDIESIFANEILDKENV